MEHATQPDYGTGQKKLGVYLIGLAGCIILTLVAFGAVMFNVFTKWQVFAIIYAAACIQFLVQVVCFLRLNTETEQGRTNVMSIIFTFIILISIVAGSLWIMWNVNYNMINNF